jgi:hypothetical protein
MFANLDFLENYIDMKKIEKTKIIELCYDTINYIIDKGKPTGYELTNFIMYIAKYNIDDENPKILQLITKLNETQYICFNILHDLDNKLLDKIIPIYFSKKENLINCLMCQYNDKIIDAKKPSKYINIEQFYEHIDKFDYSMLLEFIPKNFDGIMSKIPNDIIDKFTECVIYIDEIELIKIMSEKYDIEFNSKHLVYACMLNREEIIKYFLDHKVIPEENSLKYLYEGVGIGGQDYKSINNILPIFLECGYQLTEEDVINLCKLKIEIRPFENIKFSHKAFIACCEQNYFPEYAMYKPTMEEFTLFANSNPKIPIFKKYISKGKIKLNSLHLEILCMNYENHTIILNLLKKIKPTIKCIENMIDRLNKEFNHIDFLVPHDSLYNLLKYIRYNSNELKKKGNDDLCNIISKKFYGMTVMDMKTIRKFKVIDIFIALIKN